LLTPIARRRDDRLMFADHLLEILDHLQRDVVFFVPKIHERAGVSAMFRNNDLDRAVWINLRACQITSLTCGQNDCRNEKRCAAQILSHRKIDNYARTGTLAVRSSLPQLTHAPLIARKIAFQMQ